MSADDVAKRGFKVPTLHKAGLLLATFALIACGIYMSVLASDWTWLGRFGAFIVVTSLALEAFGSVDRYLNRIFGVVEEVMPEIVHMQVKRLPHLYGLTGKETPDQIKEIAQKELKMRLMDTRVLAERTINSDLRRLLFMIASIGTLLWGFADLINKI